MNKIAGTYTVRIADVRTADALTAGTLLTVEVTTVSEEAAATVAEVIGKALDGLGLSMPGVGSST